MNNIKKLCQWQQFIGRWPPKRVEKCCQELAAAERFTVDTSWAQVEDTNSLESWEVPLVLRCLRRQVSIDSIINIFPGWDYLWLYHIINIVCIQLHIYTYWFIFIYCIYSIYHSIAVVACASFFAWKIDVKTCGLISRRCSSMTSVWWGCERARVRLPWSSWIKKLGH